MNPDNNPATPLPNPIQQPATSFAAIVEAHMLRSWLLKLPPEPINEEEKMRRMDKEMAVKLYQDPKIRELLRIPRHRRPEHPQMTFWTTPYLEMLHTQEGTQRMAEYVRESENGGLESDEVVARRHSQEYLEQLSKVADDGWWDMTRLARLAKLHNIRWYVKCLPRRDMQMELKDVFEDRAWLVIGNVQVEHRKTKTGSLQVRFRKGYNGECATEANQI